MTTDTNIAKVGDQKVPGHGPLPPLATQNKPVSLEDSQKLELQERAVRVLGLVREDLEVFPLVFCGLLETHDPKKVVQLVKAGFEARIAALRQDHANLQTTLSVKVEAGEISQSEMLIRLTNADGKIRSMQWFLSNF